jgi:hypothetical protein
MKGHRTSYVGMFKQANDALQALQLIEIPLIQRDYAQGRDVPAVKVIRDDFLDVLIAAITGGKAVNLDFVYGEIDDGTLRPLDGQQRLTTLFLLHWYVATRLDRLVEAQPWLQFEYATRPTAELFCRELVNPDNGSSDAFATQTPQVWIKDQPWYLYAWRHDPTVTSMLNVLDAIHLRLGRPEVSLPAVWDALTATDGTPAIGFYFLPIDDMPSGEELYIKMNSRGKTLTSWENLKPRLEKLMSSSLDEEAFNRFVRRLDGAWTDVLWQLEADDGDWRIDEEFERYLEFVIEVSEWRDRIPANGTLLDRAGRVFTDLSPNAVRNIDFLFHAFDTWTVEAQDGRLEPIDTSEVFASHFASAAEIGTEVGQRILLFEESRDVDLFKQCCWRYGVMSGKNRLFTLAQTLVLLAVLLDRQEPREARSGACASFATSLTQPVMKSLKRAWQTSSKPSKSSCARSRSTKHLRGWRPGQPSIQTGWPMSARSSGSSPRTVNWSRRSSGSRTTRSCAAASSRSTWTPLHLPDCPSGRRPLMP